MSEASRPHNATQQQQQVPPVDDTENRVELGFNAAENEANSNHADNHSIQDLEPYKLHVLMDKYPKSSFCIALALFILNGVIVLILSQTGNLLEPSSEVPMYIRDNKAYMASDALKAGELDATYDVKASSSGMNMPQSVTAAVELKLVFMIKDEEDEKGLMQRKFLEMIDEIEYELSNLKGYESKCKRVYNTHNNDEFKCARHQTVTQFFDPNYFKGAIDPTYDSYPTMRNFIQYLRPSYIVNSTRSIPNKNYSESNIDQITSYWSGYGHGTYNDEAMPAIFHYVAPGSTGNLDNYTLSNVFRRITDYQFGQTPVSKRVSASMSIFFFGLPLDGFDSHIDAVKTQEDIIGKWCWDHLDGMLTEYAEKFDNEGMTMRWGCGTMRNYAIFGLLQNDGKLLILTFLSVYLLMVFNVNSFFLGTFGMLMIFLNFLPSILLYRYVTQLSYFGTLNMLGMFIILAIGADDIFVLYDTWAQTRIKYGNVSVAKRLTFTLKHAAKVMGTTSLSTIFSFIGNATSQFPAVYTFGIFSAWLVFVNYCAVVLFYPTVLVMHDKYFYTPSLKRPWCCNKRCAISQTSYESNKDTNCSYNIKPNFNEDEEDKQRKIDRWFENDYYQCIRKFKYIVLIAFGLVFIVFGYFASQLEPDPELPQIFPAGNNYQEFREDLTSNFVSQNGLQIENFIVFGLRGIDRSGTDATLSDDIGTPIYDEDFSMTWADDQQYIAQMCDDLLCGYSDYDCRYNSIWSDLMISDPSRYGSELRVVKCFMTEFRKWVETEASARPNQTDIEYILSEDGFSDGTVNVSQFTNCHLNGTFPVEHRHCFVLLFAVIWMNEELSTANPDYTSGTTNYDYWKDYIWASSESQSQSPFGIEARLRFIKISVLLDADASTNYIEGVGLYEKWEEYTTNWRDNVDGTVSVDQNNNDFTETPNGLQSISFTDAQKFQYFFLQKQIIREAFVGIFLSLTLAFTVLVLATNNYILSLMCIFVIFCIVVCVMGFVVLMGWKLGVIESIVFVLVVGMSVDFVVHLTEAYLHSNQFHFESVDKARSMLGIVGGSILSGALSTMIGVAWLILAQIGLLNKFGIIILFLITTSLLFAICAFATAVSIFGPNGEKGNVALALSRCYKRISAVCISQKEDNSLVGAVEMP
eukprot:457967_1